jgi:hypothetical protein
MGQRHDLHDILVDILGSNAVYFQPPPKLNLTYPCIIYKRERSETRFSGNLPYNRDKQYQVTVIDQDPDSVIPDKVAMLPMTRHDRTFSVDNLNHDVFTLFF